ncbi:hypothetical protein K6119_03195 [Paracrocinitomix mangrovi]|uniref:hypothetical protein n=1 Tax=Paracrocinitomix mangrovi TaxID=2862509 RepID=UPI001C8D289C|nr:hypothetical protein [Paracrocinitomix mangrovi]UKN02525.1 hypothetical protein K6119_03195 [Paracrocinitomix mangrovi]
MIMTNKNIFLITSLLLTISCGDSKDDGDSVDSLNQELNQDVEDVVNEPIALVESYDYTGRIDGQYDFNMRINTDGTGESYASYYYHTVGEKIDLKGTIKDGELELIESGDDDPEMFLATEVEEGRYEGVWKKNSGGEELKLVMNLLDDIRVSSMKKLESAMTNIPNYFDKDKQKGNLLPYHAQLFLPERYMEFAQDDNWWFENSEVRYVGIVRKKNFILLAIEVKIGNMDERGLFDGIVFSTVDHYGENLDFIEAEGTFHYVDGCDDCVETCSMSELSKDLVFTRKNNSDCDVSGCASGETERLVTDSEFQISVQEDGSFKWDKLSYTEERKTFDE